MGLFDFLFDLDGDGKVEADEEFISMMMLNHIEKEMREESTDRRLYRVLSVRAKRQVLI